VRGEEKVTLKDKIGGTVTHRAGFTTSAREEKKRVEEGNRDVRPSGQDGRWYFVT